MEERFKNQSGIFFAQDVVIYPSFGANTPHILAIRVKKDMQNKSLLLGQYVILFLENDNELFKFHEDLKAAGRMDFFGIECLS